MVILNFHGIGPITRDVDQGEAECWISVDFLKEVLDLVGDRSEVELTVDDGNHSDISTLLPELQKRKRTCIFFPCTARVGEDTFLSEEEIKEIHASGMPIGTHGKHHQPWRKLSNKQLEEEIPESIKYFDTLLDQQTKFAACPFGGYDRKSLNSLRKFNLSKVYTSDMGHCTESDWLCTRNTIRRSMTIQMVRSIIDEKPSPRKRLLRAIKTKIKSLR